MAFSPKTTTTDPDAFRAALISAIEDQGGLRVAYTAPPGVVTDQVTIIDYTRQTDEMLAAFFRLLVANTTGTTKTFVTNLQARMGY